MNTLKRIAARTIFLGAAFMPAASMAQKPPEAPANEKLQLQDLTSHPLAGTEVEIEINVKDALGQSGNSKKVKVALPQRHFRNPVARAMIGLRRTLSQDARTSGKIAQSLDVLIRAQEKNISNPQTLSALQAIRKNIAQAENDDVLDQAVHDMWAVMLQLEEDYMTRAEKDLRDAEKALREALERGADGEELKKLMEEARKAMERALKEKSDTAKDPEAEKDFEEMRKMMEEMRKMLEEMKGDPKAAQQMMQQMQQMQNMEKSGNMKQSRQDMQQQMRQMQQQMQQRQQMQKSLKELEEMIKEQKALKDRSDEELERRKADLAKIHEELEKLVRHLKEEVREERSVDNPSAPAEERNPLKKKIAFMPVVEFEKPPKTQRLNEMDADLDQSKNLLDTQKEQNGNISENQAEYLTDKLERIQQELRGMQPQDKRKEPQKGRQGQENDGQQQKKPPQDLLERIRQMLQQNKKPREENETKKMSQQQQELQKKLEKMMKEMREKDNDPGKLNNASKSMDKASKELDQNDPKDASDEQGAALKAMEEAAEDMRQQLQPGGNMPMPGQKDNVERDKPAPLERTQREPVGVDPSKEKNRTREIEEEIRKRLENPALPQRDRDYLQRLLNNKKPSPSP